MSSDDDDLRPDADREEEKAADPADALRPATWAAQEGQRLREIEERLRRAEEHAAATERLIREQPPAVEPEPPAPEPPEEPEPVEEPEAAEEPASEEPEPPGGEELEAAEAEPAQEPEEPEEEAVAEETEGAEPEAEKAAEPEAEEPEQPATADRPTIVIGGDPAARVAAAAAPTAPAPDRPITAADRPDLADKPPSEGGIPPGMVLPPGALDTAMAPLGERIEPAGQALWWRFFAAAAVIIASMAAATSASLLLYLSDIAQGLGRGEALAGVQEQLQSVSGGQPQTIMILGSDKRYADKKLGLKSRSDTIILLRLDPRKNAIALFSLPRDLKVNIPGLGIDKINAAYSAGGPKLTVKVVKQLTGLEINHLVNVDFRGFRRAVDAIGCVYVDVDRRYYHSNVGLAPSQHYAEIDVPAGYQKLCGEKGLQYVRYRHTDTDIVRGARQQDFLRQARQKISPARLIRDRKKLIDIFTRYTTSDIDDAHTMLEVLKLFLASRSEPIQQVHFKGSLGESYVTSSERQIRNAIEQFLGVRATGGPLGKISRPGAKKRRKKRNRQSRVAPAKGLQPAPVPGREQALDAQSKLFFPVYYPTLIRSGSQYVDKPRTYDLHSPDGTRYRAYKMVLRTFSGEYFGVEGTNWRTPPILKNPSERRKLGSRTYSIYYDSGRVRLVSWKTKRAVYWISNTLLQSLNSRQMLSIAKSIRAVFP